MLGTPMSGSTRNTGTWLVTGGSGFIGTNFVRRALSDTPHRIVNVDALRYSAHPGNLRDVEENPRYVFHHADIGDAPRLRELFHVERPSAVLNLAAESHVDRSIDAPAPFIQTNVVGTFTLLEAALAHHRQLSERARAEFRFVHVSTDEVYGSVDEAGLFTESSPYAPSSPYAASKAAADHLVRAYAATYGLPTIVTNASNNYGPHQFPEKLIPLVVLNALEEKPLPVYGDGKNVRDWMYVDDHVRALMLVLERGKPGASYNVGASQERTTLEVVESICSILERLAPRSEGGHRELIQYVADRPGHDRRYAIDAQKLRTELGWEPAETFESGLLRTVSWYLEHREWCEQATSGGYRRERLGLAGEKAS
jgi:dTDP-glucose 4,6-dehydratase